MLLLVRLESCTIDDSLCSDSVLCLVFALLHVIAFIPHCTDYFGRVEVTFSHEMLLKSALNSNLQPNKTLDNTHFIKRSERPCGGNIIITNLAPFPLLS